MRRLLAGISATPALAASLPAPSGPRTTITADFLRRRVSQQQEGSPDASVMRSSRRGPSVWGTSDPGLLRNPPDGREQRLLDAIGAPEGYALRARAAAARSTAQEALRPGAAPTPRRLGLSRRSRPRGFGPPATESSAAIPLRTLLNGQSPRRAGEPFRRVGRLRRALPRAGTAAHHDAAPAAIPLLRHSRRGPTAPMHHRDGSRPGKQLGSRTPRVQPPPAARRR